VAEPAFDPAALERLERLGGRQLVDRMLALFIENAPMRIAAAGKAASAGDARGVERAAHSLRSMAANVGATALQTRAEHVETTLAAGQPLDLDEAVTGLHRDFDEFRVFLDIRGGSAP
jgi:HPt (histidine-containing phosphotransfer) domain-containing protein